MLGGVSRTNPPPDFNRPLQTSTYNQPDQSCLDELTQTACFTALNKASEMSLNLTCELSTTLWVKLRWIGFNVLLNILYSKYSKTLLLWTLVVCTTQRHERTWSEWQMCRCLSHLSSYQCQVLLAQISDDADDEMNPAVTSAVTCVEKESVCRPCCLPLSMTYQHFNHQFTGSVNWRIPVGRITYIVLVQTLNHAQSINQSTDGCILVEQA